MDGIGRTKRTADAAAKAAGLVDNSFFVGSAIRYGAELTETHTLPTACALVVVSGGNIFGAEHYRHPASYGASHGKAVGTVAVAYSGDERRAESPYRVA